MPFFDDDRTQIPHYKRRINPVMPLALIRKSNEGEQIIAIMYLLDDSPRNVDFARDGILKMWHDFRGQGHDHEFLDYIQRFGWITHPPQAASVFLE